MDTSCDVSIIIVNYNTRELTKKCLVSVFEHTSGVCFEVIVSDNGSTDGSIEMIKVDFPQVILIENGENIGFGAANNRGLRIAKGKYIFYLNSDTILLNNAVKIFFDYWENAEEKDLLGALGGVLLDEELQETHSSGDFPNYKRALRCLLSCFLDSIGLKQFFRKFKQKSNKCERRGMVDYITGADLFIEKENASFDEFFFLYFEETDMQLCLERKKLKRMIIDGPKIIHLNGGSEKNKTVKYSFGKTTRMYYWDSCLRYMKKNHYQIFAFFFLKVLY